MKNNKTVGNIIGILIIVLTFIILSSKIEIFPSLTLIIYKISTNLVNYSVFSAIFNTLLRAFGAYIISLILAIITANLAYKYNLFRYIISPILSLFRSIPTISLLLIIILLVKLELITYFIVIIISLPILHESIYNSLKNINPELILVNKLDNTNSFKNFILFILPMSYSGIVNGILQTFGLSIKIQIMSELLCGSTKIKGIGVLMNYYKSNLELDNLFAITFIIIIIVYLIELFIKKLLKNVKY